MEEYKVTYDECLSLCINYCEDCGEQIQPLLTTDHAGNLTHWPGCKSCNKFTMGVSKRIYEFARYLVIAKDFYYYSNIKKYEHSLDYFIKSQTGGAARIVKTIFEMMGERTDEPRI